MSWEKTPNFKDRVEDITTKNMRRIALQVLRGVVTRTPADTGRLRGNWQVGIDSAPTAEVKGTFGAGAPKTAIPSAGKVISREGALFKDISFNTSSIYIVNNLPYAVPIEEGHGGKNPGVMVASTLAILKLA